MPADGVEFGGMDVKWVAGTPASHEGGLVVAVVDGVDDMEGVNGVTVTCKVHGCVVV